MKLTLLQIVQSIMSDMNSDEINSISDSIESQQVASICRDTYFDIVSRKEIAANGTLSTLGSYSDDQNPTVLSLPPNSQKVDWIAYNKKRDPSDKDMFEIIPYALPSDFIFNANSINSQQSNVQIVHSGGGATFSIYNDRPPSMWTTFDDELVTFDSFCNTFEDTLQGSNTQIMTHNIPTFSITDYATPDLPDEYFAMYLAECKAACFVYIKDAGNAKAEEIATRQRYVMSQKGWVAAGGIVYANYGRGSVKNSSNNFDKWGTGTSTYPSGGPLLD